MGVSTNQMLLSGPEVMPPSLPAESVTTNSVTAPAGVMRPTDFVPASVNQTLPSGPAAIAISSLPAGSGNSVAVPVGVRRPILASLPASVNQRFPPGPVTMADGRAATPVTENSVKSPAGVRRPIFSASANQMFPSGPLVTPVGELAAVGTVKAVVTPAELMRVMTLIAGTENQT